MKKLLVVVAMLLVTGMSYADSEVCSSLLTRVYVEPEGLAIIPFESGIDVGVFAGGKLGYQVNGWLSLETESAWAQWSSSDDDEDLTLIPLLFNAKVMILPGKWFVDPYIYGGVGVGFWDDSIEDVTVDNTVIGQVGLGASYYVSENLSINLDMKFFFAEPTLQFHDISADQDLNSFMIGGSATWRF